jgi:hypothetical protein
MPGKVFGNGAETFLTRLAYVGRARVTHEREPDNS